MKVRFFISVRLNSSMGVSVCLQPLAFMLAKNFIHCSVATSMGFLFLTSCSPPLPSGHSGPRSWLPLEASRFLHQRAGGKERRHRVLLRSSPQELFQETSASILLVSKKTSTTRSSH